MKNLYMLLILSLYIQIYFVTNINYIKRENGRIEYIGAKELELKDQYEYIKFEHLNIKGEITAKKIVLLL